MSLLRIFRNPNFYGVSLRHSHCFDGADRNWVSHPLFIFFVTYVTLGGALSSLLVDHRQWLFSHKEWQISLPTTGWRPVQDGDLCPGWSLCLWTVGPESCRVFFFFFLMALDDFQKWFSTGRPQRTFDNVDSFGCHNLEGKDQGGTADVLYWQDRSTLGFVLPRCQ